MQAHYAEKGLEKPEVVIGRPSEALQDVCRVTGFYMVFEFGLERFIRVLGILGIMFGQHLKRWQGC